MIRVEIFDFQNIEKLTLDIKGFCALVGESNIGKSSVCRAIKCVAENPPAAHLIRKGKKSTTVRISLPDIGKQVEWIREESGATYKLHDINEKFDRTNTEVFQNPGRSVPDPIQNLKLLRLVTPEVKSFITFASQHRYFFMLDDSSNVVKLAGELKAMATLNNSVAQSRKDRKSYAEEYKFQDRRVQELEPKSKALEGSEVLSDQHDKACKKLLQLDQTKEKLLELGTLYGKHDRLQSEIKICDAEISLLNGVEKISFDSIEGKRRALEEKKRKLEDLKSLQARYARIEKVLDVTRRKLTDLSKLEKIDISILESKTRRVGELSSILTRLRDIRDRVVELRSVTDVKIPSDEKITELGKKQSRLAVLNSKQEVLSRLKVNIEISESKIKSAASEVKQAVQDIADYIKDNPECPVCGAQVELERMIHE